MIKTLKSIGKFFCALLGIAFLISSLSCIINYFTNREHSIEYIVFAVIFLIIGYCLLRITFKKAEKHLPTQNATAEKTKTLSPSIQYIQDGNSIVHADGSPITDEEVPYLMQLGYEESLRQTGQYNGEVLDTSFVVRSLAEKKNATIIPAYQEIINFPTNCSSNIFSPKMKF